VQIAGVPVNAGDHAVADDLRVHVLRERTVEALEHARVLSAGEEARSRDMAAGLSVVEIANRPYFWKIGG
jgi:regulator of RNase E activity RraA